MSEQRLKDIKEAGMKSRAAMAWLRDNQLPAEPICYTIAYEFLFTENPELKQAVGACDLSDANYRESLEKIYEKYVVANRYQQLSMKGENAEQYVSKALSLLLGSEKDMNAITQSIDQLKNQIEKMDGNTPQSAAMTEQAQQLSKASHEACQTIHEIAVEIDNIREQYIKHKEVASKDELTQILDNQGLFTTLREVFPHADNFPIAILRVDLDQFKLFNDNNGKMMGDAVLKNIAKSFVGHLKDSDIVSRYGEDEFTIVLPQTGMKDGVSVADTLRKKVAGISLKKRGSLTPVKVSVSIGVSEFTGKGSFDAAFERAKKALLRSKDLGRNCVNCEA